MASILKVNTIQDATNSNTAMTIDSSGRITEPQKPSVTVNISDSSYVNVSNNDPIPFNSVQFSQGGGNSAFDTSAYTFTCPLSGIYLYTFYALAESSENNLDVSLYSGSTRIARIFQSTNRGISGTGVIVASASDVLKFTNSVGATRGFYGTGGGASDRYTIASFTFLG
jgi:hypothetical protein